MAATEIDTITLEIVRGKLLAAVDEMGIVIARTSMSPVIYEVLDFACGILQVLNPASAYAHSGPFLGQGHGGGFTDSFAAAGDYSDLII